MIKLKCYFSFLLILFFALNASGQVTVGSDIEPAKGALLDIKTQEPDANNITSTLGGIVLPRVRLVDKYTLEPFIDKDDPDFSKHKKVHAGLMVYNLNEITPFVSDIYVWDGNKWIEKTIGSNPISAGNGLSISESTIKLGGVLEEQTTINQAENNFSFETGNSGEWKINENDFVVKGNGNIGIGTSMPSTGLDINGNVNSDGKITVLGNTVLQGNTTIAGEFTYNYNAGLGKYLQAIDNDGTAEWVSLEPNDAVVATGTAMTGGNLGITYNSSLHYSSNHSITLGPGRWLVMMTFLLRGAGTSSGSEKVWVKIGLSRRPNPSVAGNYESYYTYRDRLNPAAPVYVESVLDRKFMFTAVTGNIVIDTDTGGRFDLTVIKDELRPNNNDSFNWKSGNLQLSGSATENVLLAIPLY